jgi:hypothetical protein
VLIDDRIKIQFFEPLVNGSLLVPCWVPRSLRSGVECNAKLRVQLFCQDESITPWKAKTGQEHKPITLLLDDRAEEDPLKEKIELRIEDEEEKAKWTGKVKGKSLTVAIYRVNKFNGIARIEGRVVAAGSPGK